MANGPWSRTSAWGATPASEIIPSFEEVMREQEKEKSSDQVSRDTRGKRNAEAWLASDPWYPGKVNRNKKRNIKEQDGLEGKGQRKDAGSVPLSAQNDPASTKSEIRSGITVVNVHRKDLTFAGYSDLIDWLKHPDHLYIGRDMTHYVPGAVGSKWQNPFKSRKIGRENSVSRYKEYILTDKTVQSNGKTLFESLEELKGKCLGCWCHPEKCHGHVLRELVEQYCP